MDTVTADAVNEFTTRCNKRLENMIRIQNLCSDAIAHGVTENTVYDGCNGGKWFSATIYKNVTDEEKLEMGLGENDSNYVIDEDATLAELRTIVQWARKRKFRVEKEYSDAEFQLRIWTDGEKYDGRLTFSANRQVVCQKVVTGTRMIPAKTEEVVEWNCSKIAFTNVKV